MHRTLLFLLSVMSLMGCVEDDKEVVYYPASEDICNTTCGFDREGLAACHSKPEVIEYIKDALLPMVNESSRVVNSDNPQACICATVILSRDGTLSNPKIIKSSSDYASKKLIEYLESARVPPVPDEAQCIAEEQYNVLPISLGG